MGGGSSKNVNALTPNYNFKHGRPSVNGTHIYPMFNMQLYRIANKADHRCAFFNDTENVTIHVAILFDYDSNITPLGKTTGFRIDDPQQGNEDDYGKYLCEVDVHAGQTELFVEGIVTGWRVDTLEARTEDNERVYRL